MNLKDKDRDSAKDTSKDKVSDIGENKDSNAEHGEDEDEALPTSPLLLSSLRAYHFLALNIEHPCELRYSCRTDLKAGQYVSQILGIWHTICFQAADGKYQT